MLILMTQPPLKAFEPVRKTLQRFEDEQKPGHAPGATVDGLSAPARLRSTPSPRATR